MVHYTSSDSRFPLATASAAKLARSSSPILIEMRLDGMANSCLTFYNIVGYKATRPVGSSFGPLPRKRRHLQQLA